MKSIQCRIIGARIGDLEAELPCRIVTIDPCQRYPKGCVALKAEKPVGILASFKTSVLDQGRDFVIIMFKQAVSCKGMTLEIDEEG